MTNGLPDADKYKSGYEAVFRRALIGVEYRAPASKDLFKLFVLNSAIRNGDARLLSVLEKAKRAGMRQVTEKPPCGVCCLGFLSCQ